MKYDLLIGIDGGGTHSTAAAAWPDGRIAAVAYGGGLNYHHAGIETVRLRMEDMVAQLCEKAGAGRPLVCVGMSALDAPADEATLARFTAGRFESGQLDLQSDAYAALMGFTCGEPGMIVICGTGSMLLLLDEQGRQHVSGGWGYLLADAGSSYTLAREALLAVIDEYEEMGEKTVLTRHALDYFGVSTPRMIIDKVYAPDFTPDRLAGFARHVLKEAESGERVACSILQRTMPRLAAQAAQLMKKSPSAHRVGLYGGVFMHSAAARACFTDTLRRLAPKAQICPLDYPPELGAIIHLMRREDILSESALHNLKTTYKEVHP
ncbi:MAG: hypothetical protein IKJ11_08195 [Clostridia bacterium]|nr:hypothetical protein [Clostridia bacterium]